MSNNNGLLISFDPGGTTGYVVFDNIDYTVRTYNLLEWGVFAWDVEDYDRMIKTCRIKQGDGVIAWPCRHNVKAVLRAYGPRLTRIVIEDFRLDRSKAQDQAGSGMPSSMMIERITVECEHLGLDHLIRMQMPSLRHNARMQNAPAEHHKACRIDHIRAAYLHARYYVLTHKES